MMLSWRTVAYVWFGQQQKATDKAFEALRAGKVIAVPTDTLYRFACDACTWEAVNRIYEIKHTGPLAICVGDVIDIKWFAVTDYLPHGLLASLLPGPVTVVFFIRAVARGLGRAVVLTSANLSGQPSSVCVKDFENLWEHCAYVYDGVVLPSSRAGSTVVDLTRLGKYKILRPGSAVEETTIILQKHSLVEES
ncbi:hypothetical protein K2173_016782 [Erythroxylum novogranatense]|uniref:Threonylcarbamoyl-AMP synthase n=1 Tax=Erythroxylum novogranatense TaxID=1862640 RepID=A0AAV8SH49_9ROSI|nr:hypothetical protein K2173_016782 [Erythroxylum novogranatense]